MNKYTIEIIAGQSVGEGFWGEVKGNPRAYGTVS